MRNILLLAISLFGFAFSQSGTLIVAREADSNFLDPGFSNIQENQDVLGLIYEPLVKWVEEGVSPWLAESWDISADGLVYTFNIRQGISFHDGTPLNAEAVAISFQRHFEESPYFYYPDRFSSIKLYSAGTFGFEDVVVLSDFVVQFTLNRPYADFLPSMTLSMAGIVSPAALDHFGEDLAQNPVGTGPFVFESWIRDDRIVLSANVDYWGEGPFLDGIVFKVVPDVSSRLLELIGGSAHVIKDLLPEQIAVVASRDHLRLLERPSLSYGAMTINVTKEPFGDRRIRQAINYAIDKDAIVESLMGAVARRHYTTMPPAFPCYTDEVETYPYDPDRAKELLAEAGYPNGFDTELWTFSFSRAYLPNAVPVAEKIQSDLAAVGIRARLSVFEGATYWDRVNKLEGHLLMAGWGAAPAMDTYMRVSVLEESKNDFGNATPEGRELAAMAVQAQVAVSLDERCAIYEEMQRRIAIESPTVVLNNSSHVWGTSALVENVGINAQGLSDFSLTRFVDR